MWEYLPRMSSTGESMTVIGTCELCGRDILAPQDTLVEVDEHAYHLECHRAIERREVAELVASGREPEDPAAA